MNILYLHGFQSSANGNTVEYLREKLKHVLYSFDLPHKPKEAIQLIEEKIKEYKIDIIIGTSLGGVYAYNFKMPRICINPGFQFTLETGEYTYFNQRENNEKEFTISDDDISYLTQLTENYKAQPIINELDHQSYILIGTEDKVVHFDKLKEFTNDNDQIIYANFGHRLNQQIIDEQVLPLIKKLENTFL